MSEPVRKYAISHISERDKKTTVIIESDEELSEVEISRILSEIMMSIQGYLINSTLYRPKRNTEWLTNQ